MPNSAAPTIVLLCPRSTISRWNRYWYTSAPALGIAYIGAYLRERGVDVRIFDLDYAPIREVIEFIRKFSVRFVGVTATSSTYSNANAITSAIKRAHHLFAVVGGPHCAADDCAVIKKGVFDVVVRGEGEQALFEVFQARDGNSGLRDVLGITFADDDGSIVKIPDRPRMAELDNLPFPLLDSFPIYRYRLGMNRRLPKPFIPMLTSRGCPFKCGYCASHVIFGRLVRYRSVGNIVTEVEHWKSRLGIGSVVFWDDTFTLDRERTVRLCAELRKLDIKWACTTRADCVDEDLLASMYDGGCRCIYFGAESFDQATLDRIQRNMRVQAIKSAVKGAKRVGIQTCVGIIIGLPWQGRDDIQRDISALFALGVGFPTINIFAPHPRTDLYWQCTESGLIDGRPSDWDGLPSAASEPFGTPTACGNLGRRELLWMKRKALVSHYLMRWRPFWAPEQEV